MANMKRRYGDEKGERVFYATHAKKRIKRKKPAEDDPGWIPGLHGNKRWGSKWRGPENYRKGRGRPD